jgi:hypothetical protein
MSEIMFQAIPAFVVSSDVNKQTLTVWCGKQLSAPTGPVPSSPPAGYIKLDFNKTLSKVSPGTIPQLDDPTSAGGRTRIWPVPSSELPKPGEKPAGGIVYYAEGYTSSPTLKDCLAASAGGFTIPSTDSLYQYQMCAQVAAGGAVKRFHGFKARIVSPAASGSNVVTVHIYKADSNQDLDPEWKNVPVNLADANLCHPSHTQLRRDSPKDAIGPIFFATGMASVLGVTLEVPKLPIGYRKLTW